MIMIWIVIIIMIMIYDHDHYDYIYRKCNHVKLIVMVAVTVSVTVRRRIISENLLLLTIFHINTFKSHRNIEKLSFWSSKNIENNSM